ncbi:MAG: MaoC family dehydratase N-terminal domain-containing protein [Propionibacteriaceae bacterium]|jgi:acyl dehydratase|nr:MaoC family dehydratase N-terminal domain-containing protein [Propionibacteriaceae bacterium]
MSEENWFDAIEVGDCFHSEVEIEVTAEAIIAFAETYDPQPGHLSEELAKATPFKGLAASGWHTAAITMRLLAETGWTDTIGLGVSLKWPTATRPGDHLRLEGRITSKRLSESRPDTAILGIEYTTLNHDGEVRQITEATVMATSTFHVPLHRD